MTLMEAMTVVTTMATVMDTRTDMDMDIATIITIIVIIMELPSLRASSCQAEVLSPINIQKPAATVTITITTTIITTITGTVMIITIMRNR
jgi:hypothetical protein